MAVISRLKRLCAIATGAFVAGSVNVHFSPERIGLHLDVGSEVYARSSGGRSGGGSFRSAPSRSSGSGRSSGSYSGGGSSPPSSNRNPSWEYRPYQRRGDSYYDPYYDNRGPVILPVPAGPPVYSDSYRGSNDRTIPPNAALNRSSDNGDWLIVGLLLLGLSAPVIMVIFSMLRTRSGGTGGLGKNAEQELANNTVTVSKIQVALLAQARDIQTELTKLSLEIDTSTSEGLLQLLQESALVLLRSPENWSHTLGTSETVHSLTQAEALFNKLAIAERSKFSVETLTNVGGQISRKEFKPDPNEGPASYIVVTLLVGTAHDHPLFDEIRTTEALKEVLEKLASMPSEYLLVFELLWSPQEATDSLTYDELLTEYSDMVQI
ncbi:DUF1517 domain-containing protein [Leptothermofonsia sp. ETS-13]|uniref:DUF1517 domain-containing protein n=1 Tax=Leptothermofonsia sp. ETS-13 TaxID=3035696 RepID=UPI003BA2BA1C